MDIEKWMGQIQEIVRKMGDSSVGLEESVKLYQEGIGIALKISDRLNVVQEDIKVLSGQAEQILDGLQELSGG